MWTTQGAKPTKRETGNKTVLQVRSATRLRLNQLHAVAYHLSARASNDKHADCAVLTHPTGILNFNAINIASQINTTVMCLSLATPKLFAICQLPALLSLGLFCLRANTINFIYHYILAVLLKVAGKMYLSKSNKDFKYLSISKRAVHKFHLIK